MKNIAPGLCLPLLFCWLCRTSSAGLFLFHVLIVLWDWASWFLCLLGFRFHLGQFWGSCWNLSGCRTSRCLFRCWQICSLIYEVLLRIGLSSWPILAVHYSHTRLEANFWHLLYPNLEAADSSSLTSCSQTEMIRPSCPWPDAYWTDPLQPSTAPSLPQPSLGHFYCTAFSLLLACPLSNQASNCSAICTTSSTRELTLTLYFLSSWDSKHAQALSAWPHSSISMFSSFTLSY